MQSKTDLRSRLGIDQLIIQAPMAGATTPELVAAVSNAGGLGMLPGAYLSPAQIGDAIAATRRLTTRPFGVNLFAGGDEQVNRVDPQPMLSILAGYHEELSLPAPAITSDASYSFEEQLQVILNALVPIFSFTFGIPSSAALVEMKAQRVTVLGTATTVDEARQLEAAGVDAIVAQGSEAGAHRGTFSHQFDAALIGTMALIPQMVDAVSVPVIASGGIMDGRGIVAAEALGAAGVQMGTAFLTCREADIPDAYKAAIWSAKDHDTTVTRAFSGRPARGIVNQFIEDMWQHEERLLPFPLQNSATRPLRAAAAARGDTRLMSLWAGQGAGLARDLPAEDLMQQLLAEAAGVRAQFTTVRA